MAQRELVYVVHCNIRGYHVYKENLGSIYERHPIHEICENFVL